MKTKNLIPIILAASFAISAVSACADSFHDIAIQARAKYAATQESWQRDLAELTARANPGFREIAKVQHHLQAAYVEQSTARFRYLLEHDCSRIILTNGLSQFANFEWTEADTKALAKVDPSYVVLQKKIETLKKQNDKEPDWPKFKEWFRETFSKSSDYKALLRNFQEKSKEVEDLLKKYKP